MATTAPPAGRTRQASADWRDLADLANELANVEGFVPKALLGRPPAILATLLAGAELGLGPIASLRAIYIIEGKATLSAEAARALVYAAGHALDIEADDTHATARGKRRDSTRTRTIEWTLDRARRAKLADKQVWRQYPRAMLTARATAELCHAMFSDVLLGLDIAETAAEDAEQAAEPKPAKATRSRKTPAIDTEVTQTPLEASTTAGAHLSRLGMADPSSTPSEGESASSTASAELGRSDDAGAEAPSEGDDTPTPSPAPTRYGLAQVQLRRLHAKTAETFPNADRVQLDTLRHALVAVVTRARPDGSTRSSAELTETELMGYEALLNFIANGSCIVGERPDGVIELRQEGWLYVAHHATEPPYVETVREGG